MVKISHCFVTLLALFLSLLGEAAADRVPGTAFAGPFIHFTTDMDMVEFSFWPNLQEETSSPPVAKFKLPRAYIIFASRKTDRENRLRIPRSVSVKRIRIMLTHPEGAPYSIALQDYRTKYRVSERMAAKALRPFRISAQIRGSKFNAHKRPYLYPQPSSDVGDVMDLEDYPMSAGDVKNENVKNYFGPEGSLIRKIYCSRTRAKARPRKFCSYYVVLNRSLIATLDFVDFRVHGGVEFAQRRVRAFLRAVCRYIECDAKLDRVPR